MSTEKTSDLFRRAADAWVGDTEGDAHARCELRDRADRLEQEQRPLPERPGWHELIVVERLNEEGEKESCTGAMLTTEEGEFWATPTLVGGAFWHSAKKQDVTIRWAEEGDPTPGQTVREAASAEGQEWPTNDPFVKDQIERITAAVLAAYAIPTLTPVGEFPEPGTRGLLPLVSTGAEWRTYADTDQPTYICGVRVLMAEAILADPRSDGAE